MTAKKVKKTNWAALVIELKRKGVAFERGLLDVELSAAEKRFNIKFPPDLRSFLQTALPVSNPASKGGFPNWRSNVSADIAKIKSSLAGPYEGIEFDVVHNVADKRLLVMMRKAPVLIPVYSHRYIPAYPEEENNPVFSVVQTDIILYGKNLESYLRHEFLNEKYTPDGSEKPVPFWSDLVEQNNVGFTGKSERPRGKK